jgi:hypothetical protein
MDVRFNNRKDAEKMFNDEGLEIGMIGRTLWLIFMLFVYIVVGIPTLMIEFILTVYSQIVTLVLFATNPLAMKKDLSDREEPS